MLSCHTRPTDAPDSLTANIVRSLKDSAVRDLAWVIGSPGLLDASYAEYGAQVVDDAWCSAQLQACMPWLSTLDNTPHTLHAHIAARPSRRLGHYFETLISFWFSHRADAQIIASNLQVRETGRTLGEYDLLWRDGAGGVRHWEMAVKYYLQATPLPEQRAYIGPGARDRLDLKLDRVFGHQLGLGRTPAGLTALSNVIALPGSIELDTAQAFIKGYLFYPAAQLESPSAPGVSDTHLRGWWIHVSAALLPQTAHNTGWTILPRLRWLAPARLEADASVMTNAELCTLLEQHFALTSEALQVAELQRDADGTWHECARGFVMCKTWPDIDGIKFNLE